MNGEIVKAATDVFFLMRFSFAPLGSTVMYQVNVLELTCEKLHK